MSDLGRTAVEAAKGAVKAKVLVWLAGILIPVALIVGAVVLVVVLVAALFSSTSEEASAYECAPGSGASASNMTVSERQNYYARIVIGVGESMGFGDDAAKAEKIALMTVAQESAFQNYANDGVHTANRDGAVSSDQVFLVGAASLALAHDAVGTDNDSVGIFQQRPWAGWATFPGQQPTFVDIATHVEKLMNPQWAAQVFFLHLQQVSGWQAMPPAAAAQAVQVSAYPDAYAKHEALAEALLSANSDAPALPLLSNGLEPSPFDPPELGEGTVSLCGGPLTVDGSAATAIDAARQQIGLPYSWGGGTLDGPGPGCGCAPYFGDRNVIGFDCSGLTRYAIYQATRITMSRTAASQYINAATWGFEQVAYTGPADLAPGDLVFFSHTSDPSDIYHVALATGQGTYIEASGHGKGVLEQPAWESESMWIARPSYASTDQGEQ